MHKYLKYFVGGMFVIVPLLMVAGMIWNYMLYQECRADGLKAYQCHAMISNPSYVAVDDVTGYE
jgi:hypothetical protein